MIRPLADALDTLPDELMDWGGLLAGEAEHQDKMREVLPLIGDGISVEGGTQKYVLLRILGEFVSSFDAKTQEKLVS